MAPIATSRLVWFAALLVMVIVTSVVLGHGHFGGMLADRAGRITASTSIRLHRGLAYARTLLSRRDLASENLRLKEQAMQAIGNQARLSELERENEFLQSTLGLHERMGHGAIEGAVFSYIRQGGVRQVIVNRGGLDGVSAGDIVMTGQGALVGVALDVASHHAIVRALGDPSLEVTGRFDASEVTGLIRVDAAQGLIVDLVQKAETVTEGQAVITSGNDQFPAGLLIGTVKSVDSAGATLFKIVRIAPAIGDLWDGKVLILRQ
jgi:rod shape-determining protein MreC